MDKQFSKHSLIKNSGYVDSSKYDFVEIGFRSEAGKMYLIFSFEKFFFQNDFLDR